MTGAGRVLVTVDLGRSRKSCRDVISTATRNCRTSCDQHSHCCQFLGVGALSAAAGTAPDYMTLIHYARASQNPKRIKHSVRK